VRGECLKRSGGREGTIERRGVLEDEKGEGMK